jgi:hypothetical protein
LHDAGNAAWSNYRGEALVTPGMGTGLAGRQIGMMQEENAVTQNGRMQSTFYSRLINGSHPC